MTEAGTTRASRAVACPGWQWRRGMLTMKGLLVTDLGLIGLLGVSDLGLPSELPDLADPGTLGHLLALVREAWSEPSASVIRYTRPGGDYRWFVVLPDADGDPDRIDDGHESEAEALVAALEAAPPKGSS